jgi:hypothetical protein
MSRTGSTTDFQMPTTITRTLPRISDRQIEFEALKTIIMLCGVGLTVSIMCLSYGIDLSPGFF